MFRLIIIFDFIVFARAFFGLAPFFFGSGSFRDIQCRLSVGYNDILFIAFLLS